MTFFFVSQLLLPASPVYNLIGLENKRRGIAYTATYTYTYTHNTNKQTNKKKKKKKKYIILC